MSGINWDSVDPGQYLRVKDAANNSRAAVKQFDKTQQSAQKAYEEDEYKEDQDFDSWVSSQYPAWVAAKQQKDQTDYALEQAVRNVLGARAKDRSVVTKALEEAKDLE